MKKLILTLVVFMTVLTVKSQNSMNLENLPPAEDRAAFSTEMMKDKLNLTEEQVPKVEAINLKAALEMDKLKKLNDKVSKFKAFRKIQQDKDDSLKAILSKEQFKAYKKMKDEMKKKLKEMKK